uniref:Uncharacterized protein n=1 Tax=Caenorhabditis tropicalis TaxID=1561998 RepID=A0A1I7V129_9PELO
MDQKPITCQSLFIALSNKCFPKRKERQERKELYEECSSYRTKIERLPLEGEEEQKETPRKELYAKCPSLRKLEDRFGYRINTMKIKQSPEKCEIRVDNFEIVFDTSYSYGFQNKTCAMKMRNGERLTTLKRPVNLNLVEASEKWVTHLLNRPGTRIQHLKLMTSPICILKCDPMRVINLTMDVSTEVPGESSSWLQTTVPVSNLRSNRLFRDDTLKTARSVVITDKEPLNEEIFYDLQANQIIIDTFFSMQQLVRYCTDVAESGRPIGFRCEIRNMNMDRELDWLEQRMYGRKTRWNGRKCVTIPLDDASELNIHDNIDNSSVSLVIEVNPEGTAKKEIRPPVKLIASETSTIEKELENLDSLLKEIDDLFEGTVYNLLY